MLYLLNVPQWTTSMPPVALTCLAGYMESRKINYAQVDINIKFYNHIFRRSFFNKIKKCLVKDTRMLLGGNYVDYNEYLASNIEEAITVIKSKQEILSREKLDWSNKIVTDYLKMLNQYFSPICISLNSMTFDLDDCVTYSNVFERISNLDKYQKIISIYRELLAEIDFEDNSLIGFSINNISQLVNSYFIAKVLREKITAHIFLGGSYLSANRETLINCQHIFEAFDSLCLYDGEHAIENLYNHLYFGEKIYVENILLSKPDCLDKTRYFIENIQELPAPSYVGIDFSDYMSPIRMVSIPVSRGCYGNCAFCSYNHLASSKWREQKIDHIIEQIKQCKKKYGARYFFFSVATMSPAMAIKLSEKLIKEQVEIYWATGIRMEKAFDEKTISLMAKAGCIRLDIGIESASQKVLDSMNKMVEVKYFRDIIQKLHKHGILPYLYIIKNFPTERVEDWNETLLFLNDVSNDILGFSCYDFFLSRNTTVFENPEEFGVEVLLTKSRSADVIETIQSFYTKFISDADKRIKDEMLDEFYKNKKNKFIRYGNAYVDRNMPLTFQNQMYYKTTSYVQKENIEVDENKKYIVNGNGAILLKDDGDYLKLYSIKTGHTLMIRRDLIQEMSGKSIVDIKLNGGHGNLIGIYKNLLIEGIIE